MILAGINSGQYSAVVFYFMMYIYRFSKNTSGSFLYLTDKFMLAFGDMSLNNCSILRWTIEHLSVKRNDKVEIPASFHLPSRCGVCVCDILLSQV